MRSVCKLDRVGFFVGLGGKMIEGGYTIWARQVTESDIFFYKPAVWFKIWFFLVTQANHKDNNLFKTGEVFASYEDIMRVTRASKTQVHDCIHYLERDNMITSRKTTRGMVRYIVNYGRFQDPKSYKTTTGQQQRQHGDNTEAVPIHKHLNTKTITTPTPSLKTYLAPDGTPRTVEQIAQKVLDHFRINKIGNFKTIDPFVSKLDYWLGIYSLEDIQNAIVGVSKDKFWKDKMTPTILFRRKNPQGEGVDYIGDMLHVYRKNYVRPDQT